MESGPCYLKIYSNETNQMYLFGDGSDVNSSTVFIERFQEIYSSLRYNYFYCISVKVISVILCNLLN